MTTLDTPARRQVKVVGAAIFNARGQCLITQRSATMANALKWEFPGGKVEAGEGPQEALIREIQEELDIVIEVDEWIAQGRAPIDATREVVLDVYRARLRAGTVKLAEHAQYQWVDVTQFGDYDWADADVPIVDVMMGTGGHAV